MSTNKRAYTINIHSGKEVLHDIIDDLALQVIRKSVDGFNSGNPRIKKYIHLDGLFKRSYLVNLIENYF